MGIMNLDSFFPTVIGNITNPDHASMEKELVDHCLQLSTEIATGGTGWLSNKTYNTSNGQYDIFSDANFSKLNQWVRTSVEYYCNRLNIQSQNLTNNGSWFNIYRKHDFQENHVHPTSVVLAIYVLCCDSRGARIFFNTPINNMYHVKKTVVKQEMVDQIQCQSIPGMLIIFPSYLNHAVERHESDQIRISISYNFKQS
jgi:uncharacterized protein (TIGR02466 family)